MPQRLRLRKHLGLLLGDQMIKRPDQPVVIRRVVLENSLRISGCCSSCARTASSIACTGATSAESVSSGILYSSKDSAVPGTNSTGAEFSPREQGAGLVNVKNVVTTKASPAPTARRSGPSARITCARHSSSAPTASTARRSSATAGPAAHGTRRPKPMTATITLHCLRQ